MRFCATTCEVKMTGYWPRSLLACLWTSLQLEQDWPWSFLRDTAADSPFPARVARVITV